jgi:two-component system, OmpR family, phosphate regulon sensor histidine kinase PhoR
VAEKKTEFQNAPDQSAGDRALLGAYEAALAVASELKLEDVLQRIVDLAREVVPARYAALGVADEDGHILEFITSGITPEERLAIGPIPQGHGLLAALIQDGVPLLIPDIAKDPRSVGFPANHPPMRSLLGVPVQLGQRTLGDLYLTERLGQANFDEADLVAVQALAAHAAAAIDRAQLYRDIERGRQRAEEQRDDLRIILDNLPSGVLICGEDGRIELANSAAVEMIFAAASVVGALPRMGEDVRLLGVDGVPVPTDQLPQTRAFRGEGDRNRQFLLEGWDGRKLPILVQSALLRGIEGGSPRVVLVMQDVTKLREAEQLKDDFLSLISHEFRTPLSAIHGGAYLLAKQGDELEGSVRAELLADIVTESQRLDQMLANMLNLTAIQAGHLIANTEPVLLGPIIRSAAEQVSERSPRHEFPIEVQAGLPAVEADPDLLTQVLINLYENAVKYSPNGGAISTKATRTNESIAIAVTDCGIGIAEEYAQTVFERFRRVGGDKTVRGMGLGLYLSRHLVEAQGGRISASSPGVGLGSTFTVALPIAAGWSEAAW